MLLLSSICAHLVVCGALLIPLPNQSKARPYDGYQPLSQSSAGLERSQRDGSRPGIVSSVKSVCASARRAFNLSLLKDCSFWIIDVIVVAVRVTKSAWYIYFVPSAVAKGFSAESAALMLTAAGLGRLSCVLLVSVSLFRERVTSTDAMIVCVILMSTSLFIGPWMTAGWTMAANAVLFTGAMGSILALSEVTTKEFLGSQRMASALGWMGCISGGFRFLSGFIPGWIYDQSGSYDLAFLVLGAINITAVIPLLSKRLNFHRIFNRHDNKPE